MRVGHLREGVSQGCSTVILTINEFSNFSSHQVKS